MVLPRHGINRATRSNSPDPAPLARLEGAGEGIPDVPTFPNGCHICEVEVDPETEAQALVALERMAGDRADPLSGPASSLRAQLAAAYPQLDRKGHAVCPA